MKALRFFQATAVWALLAVFVWVAYLPKKPTDLPSVAQPDAAHYSCTERQLAEASLRETAKKIAGGTPWGEVRLSLNSVHAAILRARRESPADDLSSAYWNLVCISQGSGGDPARAAAAIER